MGGFHFLWKNLIIRNILIICVVAIALLWGIMHALDDYTRHDQALVMPDLRALSLETAADLLRNAHLRYEVVDSVYSNDVPPGAVIDQIPQANAKVKENRIVFLTVNARSRKMIPLPDTEELSQRQALATLRAAGFRVDSVTYVDYEFRDLVIGVHYNDRPVFTGEKLPAGSRLDVLVGNGHVASPVAEIDSIPLGDDYSDDEWFE